MVERSSDPACTHPVVIVTGGSSAAGRELAGELARRGFAIVLVYLDDPRAADTVVGEILAAGGIALAVRADIADELDVERLFNETAAAFGSADVVAHAVRHDGSIVNRHAARRLTHGGAIVSVSGRDDDALAPALAVELRDRAITINGLAPGLKPSGQDRDVADLVELLERWRARGS